MLLFKYLFNIFFLKSIGFIIIRIVACKCSKSSLFKCVLNTPFSSKFKSPLFKCVFNTPSSSNSKRSESVLLKYVVSLKFKVAIAFFKLDS